MIATSVSFSISTDTYAAGNTVSCMSCTACQAGSYNVTIGPATTGLRSFTARVIKQ